MTQMIAIKIAVNILVPESDEHIFDVAIEKITQYVLEQFPSFRTVSGSSLVTVSIKRLSRYSDEEGGVVCDTGQPGA